MTVNICVLENTKTLQINVILYILSLYFIWKNYSNFFISKQLFSVID